LALSRTHQKEPELHDDTKGQQDNNDFSGGCFFRMDLAGEFKVGPPNNQTGLLIV
jgi:hypothetical protein